jgi:hypothetical protein
VVQPAEDQHAGIAYQVSLHQVDDSALNAPTTKIIGGPSPNRSNAMAVPSLERTLSICFVSFPIRRVTIIQSERTITSPKEQLTDLKKTKTNRRCSRHSDSLYLRGVCGGV